jgi:SSS family solute:Na+ symporter
VILVAIIYLPLKLGGWGDIFDKADAKFTASPAPGDGILLNANHQLQYITLALGSALALFLYPHSITGVLASKNRNVIKRNMSALPAYSFLLGLLALLGFAAIAAGVKPLAGAKPGSVDSNTVVPLLFDTQFPAWFAGVAFAAIGIGALVPAAIMSIAAANLFTRNIYKEYLKRDATHAQEAQVSKIASLVVKIGAVAFIVFLDPQFSIDLQLIGGIVILQTAPAVALGLYTRWFHRGGLIAGWAAGMGLAMWMLWQIPNAATGRKHFGGSAFALNNFGFDSPKTIYVGFVAVLVNVVVAVLVTLLLRALKTPDGIEGTEPDDYFADEGDPRLEKARNTPDDLVTST